MNVATSDHPARPQLAAFSLGDLDPEAAAEIEAHVERCPACSQILLELASEADSFVSLLQRAGREQAVTVSTEDTDRSGAKQPAADAELPDMPPELANHPRYRIIERLGRGGMGDVYQAEHRLMNRLVALKVINRRLLSQPGAIERFHREVQAAARLVHPNIVTAFDAEQAGELHFLAMEYVPGVDLAQVLKQRGPLPIHEACDYVRQAAIGLQHAHEQGMVHRDIKPHNLILAEGHVKILDFGLASFANETLNEQIALSGQPPSPDAVPDRLTSLGAMLGTPDYVAPEQVENPHAVDIRADIYSLGCTLYALLAGRPPFSEATVADKIRAHAQQEPEPIGRLRPDVPTELAEIIRRMLAKDPADRPATPRAVAESLAAFGQREAVRGATTGFRRRLSSVRLRWLTIPGPVRRLAVAAAASLAVLAVVWAAVIRVRITNPQGESIEIVVPDGSTIHAPAKGPVEVTLPPQGSKQKPTPPKKRGTIGWPHDGQNLGNTNFHPRASSRRSGQISFRVQWDEPNALTVRTADVTGDGRLEVIYLENVGRARPLVVVDGAGQELWRRDPVAESRVKHPDAQTNPRYDVADLDGDGACEIVVNVNCDTGWTSNKPNRLLVYRGDGRLQENLVIEDAAAAHVLVADVEGDAQPKIVAGMADYEADHGAYVYRLDGTLVGRMLTGEALTVRALADLDGDGLQEAVFCNFASHNKQANVNGVDDFHAYVLAVRGDGRSLWVRELGTCATDASLADLRGKGTPDLVAFRNQEPLRYHGRSEVHLLDNATGQTRARYDGPQDLRWTSWAIADLDRDEGGEIAVGNVDGHLRLLASDLRLLRERVWPRGVDVFAANDLDGDGAVELVAASDTSLFVLDGKLEIRWSVNLGVPIRDAIVSDVDDDGANDMLVETEGGLLFLRSEGAPVLSAALRSAALAVHVDTGATLDLDAVAADGTNFPNARVEGDEAIWEVPLSWFNHDAYTGSGFANLPVKHVVMSLGRHGEFACGVFADSRAEALTIFADSVGYVGAQQFFRFSDELDFSLRPVKTAPRSGYRHPLTCLDRRQNILACAVAKAYWICATKKYVQAEIDSFGKLYDCTWWFWNGYSSPISVLKSCLYFDCQRYRSGLPAAACRRWCPAKEGTSGADVSSSRVLELKSQDAQATGIVLQAANDDGRAAQVWLDDELLVNEPGPRQPAVGRKVRIEAYPKRVKLVVDQPRATSYASVVLAQLGGVLEATRFCENVNGADNPPGAYDGNPPPMLLQLPTGWSRDQVEEKGTKKS